MNGELHGPVHLVGVGGMHMSAIALLLLERGIAVTGSDLRRSALTAKVERAGGTVFEGHDAANLGNPELVVTTAAASDDNPEIAEARRRGIPVILRAEMVARLMEGKRVIAVAGSHGKTTTSSLIAFILREAGRQPMYLLGGESIDLDGHAAWGEGELCVVEADEYKRAFHEYTPAVAVVTNVEPDHLDYYGTAEAYHDAFVEFERRIVQGGRLVACWDDAGAQHAAQMVEDRPIRIESYGIEGSSFWRAINIRRDAAGATFDLLRAGVRLGEVRLPLPGDHFIRDAVAAAAVSLGEDVPFAQIAAALAQVHGAHRRFERTGEARGVTVMDSYAHHPTEARADIAAARTAFPGQKLIVVYQPHTYSRIAYLWDEWTTCFQGADELIVLETYAAREAPEAGRSASDLAAAIARPKARYARDFDEAARLAVELARPGDVIFTMGAGDVVEVGPRILE
ncbi:MAG TPA: UDP-N-acetylmuramate--L-alanine ligase, partial [Tepidiformaceae bacterium]|nr:UDP-N-acetylmuramate--L-alanine ligase [Tepidiformaceae bacterium]